MRSLLLLIAAVSCAQVNAESAAEYEPSTIYGYGSNATGGSGGKTCTVRSYAGTMDCIRRNVASGGKPLIIRYARPGRYLAPDASVQHQMQNVTWTGLDHGNKRVTLVHEDDSIQIYLYRNTQNLIMEGLHLLKPEGTPGRYDGSADHPAGGSQGVVMTCGDRDPSAEDNRVVFYRMTFEGFADSARDVLGNCRGVTSQQNVWIDGKKSGTVGGGGAAAYGVERMTSFADVFIDTYERNLQVRGRVRDFESYSTVVFRSGLYGLRLRERGPAVPNRVNLYDALFLDAGDRGFMQENFPAGNCYESGSYFAPGETTRCAAASPFPRKPGYRQPPRIPPEKWVSTFLADTGNPQVGAPGPSAAEVAKFDDLVKAIEKATQGRASRNGVAGGRSAAKTSP